MIKNPQLVRNGGGLGDSESATGFGPRVLIQLMHPTFIQRLLQPESLRQHSCQVKTAVSEIVPPTDSCTPFSKFHLSEGERFDPDNNTPFPEKNDHSSPGQAFSMPLSTLVFNHRLSGNHLPAAPHSAPEDRVSTNVLTDLLAQRGVWN